MKNHILATLWAACLLASLGAANAAPVSPDQANKRWRQEDDCVSDATKQVPDHNAAALRKRDELVDACLKLHHLPPRAGLATPPTAGADAKPSAPVPAAPN